MFNEWTVELKAMADRIITMRQKLFDALRARGGFPGTNLLRISRVFIA